jgi:hypothetical protein
MENKPMIVDVLKVREVVILDKADITYRQSDGALMATPRVGRIGIQLYRGDELGKPDMSVVRVWRPEDEVMNKDAMATLTHRPVTNDHPPVPVTKDNWKKYAVGNTGDTVARDGEFIRVPMMLSDGSAIKDFQDGKKELSLGYTSNLEWRNGTTPQGDQYDAVQTNIRINHLAVVDAARGGSKLAIGDSTNVNQPAIDTAKKLIADGSYELEDALVAGDSKPLELAIKGDPSQTVYPFAVDGTVYRSALVSIKAQADASSEASIVGLCDELINLIDAKDEEHKMATDKQTTVNVDGVPVEMSDIAASVVLRRMKHLEEQATDLRTKLEAEQEKGKKQKSTDEATIATHVTTIATKDAELVTVKKQLEDSKLTPAKLDELVKDRALVAGKAKVVLGDKLVVDGKSVQEIRRQVVVVKLGDSAKGWSVDQVNASFVALTADVKPEQVTQAADAMARTFSGKPTGGTGVNLENVNDAYDKRIGNAWKGPQATQ